MVKRLAGFEPVLSLHKPLQNLVEGHLTVAWNWTSSFLKSPEREATFLSFPLKAESRDRCPCTLSFLPWLNLGVSRKSVS
jgi:hypothetical protein